MKCTECGNEDIKEGDNFCNECGEKLKRKCKCWVLKKDNYDCGESSCPGYKILATRKKESSR